MQLARDKPKNKLETTITLINVVFLMLIFFMIAGALAPPINKEISLVETQFAKTAKPPNALAIDRKGRISYRGKAITFQTYLSAHPQTEDKIRLAIDKDLLARKLITMIAKLKAESGKGIQIITLRQQP